MKRALSPVATRSDTLWLIAQKYLDSSATFKVLENGNPRQLLQISGNDALAVGSLYMSLCLSTDACNLSAIRSDQSLHYWSCCHFHQSFYSAWPFSSLMPRSLHYSTCCKSAWPFEHRLCRIINSPSILGILSRQILSRPPHILSFDGLLASFLFHVLAGLGQLKHPRFNCAPRGLHDVGNPMNASR